MSHPSQVEAELRAAVEAARRVTDAQPTDDVRVRAVYRRIEEQRRASHRLSAGVRWLIASGALVGTAAAVLAVLQLRPHSIETHVAAPIYAELVRRSGEVRITAASQGGTPGSETTRLAQATRLQLDRDARVDLRLATAAVSLHGPATLHLGPALVPTLEDGIAVFSVQPQPPGAIYRVLVGDSTVSVHGTQFVLQAQATTLEATRVSEGAVHITGADAASTVVLRPGEQDGELSAEAQAALATTRFDAPWWSESVAATTGLIEVHSTPKGADVEIAGVSVGVTPLLVRWPTGHREVAVRAAGFREWHGSTNVAPRATSRLAIVLETLAPSPPVVAAERRPRPASDPWRLAEASLAARQCSRLDGQVQKLVAQSPQPEDKARALLLGAECHLRTRHKKRALQLYERIANEYPETITAGSARFEAAKISTELGDTSQALSYIETYLAKYRSGTFIEPASFRRCDLLIRLRRLDEADRCLAAYVDTYPHEERTGDALLLRATLAHGKKAWSMAADLYGRYLSRNPGAERAEQALFKRIQCLREGRLPGLREAVTAYRKQFPNGPHAAEMVESAD